MQRVATLRQPLDERQREACAAQVPRRLRQQPPNPPRRGPLEPRVSPLREHNENRERILDAHLGQPDGRGLDQLQVASGQRTLKPTEGRALRRHEQTFARQRSFTVPYDVPSAGSFLDGSIGTV